jgi:hypothetical protein
MRTAPGRAAVLVIALLLATCPASPAPARATAVDGGGSFDDAPLLHAGTYTDTILPRETLFYAVALGEGQRLRVNADVDLSGGSKSERGDPDALGGLRLSLYSPLRERLDADYVGPLITGGRDNQSDSDARRGPRILAADAADRRKTAGLGEWIGPGIYTFTAAISAIYHDPGAAVEFPLRLQITAAGPPVPARGIGPGPLGADTTAPAGRRNPTRPIGPAAPATSDGRTRVADAVLLAAAAGALLVGALLGGLAGGLGGRPGRPAR